MKLPNYAEAIVPQAKITEYLLSNSHSIGKGKAGFFTRFGYARENWQALKKSLLKHAADYEVAKIEPSPFGTRYVIEGDMPTLDGRNPFVRTIWFINTGQEIPRFVSAYPIRRKEQ